MHDNEGDNGAHDEEVAPVRAAEPASAMCVQ